jgi:hypothetical protein
MTRLLRHALLVLLAAWPVAVLGQTPAAPPPERFAAVPSALRGAWFSGECTAPQAMLQLTARSVARLPEAGPARLVRFIILQPRGEWLVGTGGGAEAPRLMLRGSAGMLQTAEPDAKLRDERLPGDTPLMDWRRCPGHPAGFAMRHGEGIAMLGMLEALEAACAPPSGGVPGCVDSLILAGDASGDRLLSIAELARLVRGMAWVLATAEEATPERLLVAQGGGLVAGVATARLMMDSLDYDGDGRLSAAELAQDRAVLAAGVGSGAGTPIALDGIQDVIGLLRGLTQGLLLDP